MTLSEAGPIIAGVGVMLTLIWNIYQATIGRQKADQAQDARIVILETKLEVVENRLSSLERKIDQLTVVAVKTETLEVKMGLFWHLVEDNMADLIAKANPISLTPAEKAAAMVYREYKAKSPTKTLIMLDKAIIREMPNLEIDERPGFTLLQGAIRAQLVDRHEYPYQ